MSDALVRNALDTLDHALEDRPDKVYDDMQHAVRSLVRLRDALIAARRETGGADDKLRRCNAVLSLVFGGEYPLQGVRRERLEKAREAVAELLG